MNTFFNKQKVSGKNYSRLKRVTDCQFAKAGATGGLISDNSKIDNNSWVSVHSKVKGECFIIGKSCITGTCVIDGECNIINSSVSGNVRMSRSVFLVDAKISGNCKACFNGYFYGNASPLGKKANYFYSIRHWKGPHWDVVDQMDGKTYTIGEKRESLEWFLSEAGTEYLYSKFSTDYVKEYVKILNSIQAERK